MVVDYHVVQLFVLREITPILKASPMYKISPGGNVLKLKIAQLIQL